MIKGVERITYGPQHHDGVTGQMRSNYSDRVHHMANRNYSGNGGHSVKLNCGGLGDRTDYLQTWLQGADARADARAALQFGKQIFRLL
jgi:hypothetical protein